MKLPVLKSMLALMTMSLIFVACNKEDSADVNQDKIYAVYELFYNQNSDKTVAVCRLRFGGATGTLLEANSPAYVLFNGDTLPYSVAYSGHAKEYAGLINSGTFVYSDVDGNVFTNTTPNMGTVAHPAGFDTIVKSQANTYTWSGNSLVANERMELFVGTWTWGQDAAFLATGVGSNNIVMGVNQLSNLAVGGSTLYVDRVTEVAATQVTSEGGVCRSRYRPTNVQVQIVP